MEWKWNGRNGMKMEWNGMEWKWSHSLVWIWSHPYCVAYKSTRVGQNHIIIGIYGVLTVFLAGKSPYIRSYTLVTMVTNLEVTFSQVVWLIGHVRCVFTVMANSIQELTTALIYLCRCRLKHVPALGQWLDLYTHTHTHTHTHSQNHTYRYTYRRCAYGVLRREIYQTYGHIRCV